MYIHVRGRESVQRACCGDCCLVIWGRGASGNIIDYLVLRGLEDSIIPGFSHYPCTYRRQPPGLRSEANVEVP